MEHSNEPAEPSESSAGAIKQKLSRWLIGLHLFGGMTLYAALNKSRIEVGGAVPAILIAALGYFGSYLLVSAIWKRNPSKTVKIIIVLLLIVVYFSFSVALAILIDISFFGVNINF